MTYDRGALDYVGSMTDDELAAFINEARKPTQQLTQEDLTRMHSERRYDEIVEAQARGQLDGLLGIDRYHLPLNPTKADIQEAARRGEFEQIEDARMAGRLTGVLGAEGDQQ